MTTITPTAPQETAGTDGPVLADALPLDRIRTDGGTQMRVSLDQDVYLEYRDQWKAGVKFEPIVVFDDGNDIWLADGFHRFYGAREAGRKHIPARVHRGTQRNAILYAVGANADHGLRRTNDDKRLAVETLLNDEAWCHWSDRAIASRCKVTHPFVASIRRQLETVTSSAAAKSASAPRIGKDKKVRKKFVKVTKDTAAGFCREGDVVTAKLLEKFQAEQVAAAEFLPADFVTATRKHVREWVNRCPPDDLHFIVETLEDLAAQIKQKMEAAQ